MKSMLRIATPLTLLAMIVTTVGCEQFQWPYTPTRPGMDPTVQQTGDAQQPPRAMHDDQRMTAEHGMWHVSDPLGSSEAVPTAAPASGH